MVDDVFLFVIFTSFDVIRAIASNFWLQLLLSRSIPFNKVILIFPLD